MLNRWSARLKIFPVPVSETVAVLPSLPSTVGIMEEPEVKARAPSDRPVMKQCMPQHQSQGPNSLLELQFVCMIILFGKVVSFGSSFYTFHNSTRRKM